MSSYFARIEEHFGRRRGGPVVLSPKDWELIERWQDDGVPLQVVLRGINRAFDRFDADAHRGDKINSLRYCEQHVAEAWERHREAHAGEGGPPPSPADDAARHLEAVAKACRDRAREAAAGHGPALVAAADGLERLAAACSEMSPREVDAEAARIEGELEQRLSGPDGEDRASRRSFDLPPFSPWAA